MISGEIERVSWVLGLEVEEVLIGKEVAGGRQRPSGDAYVRFRNKDHTLEALKRDRNNMGSRYDIRFSSLSLSTQYFPGWVPWLTYSWAARDMAHYDIVCDDGDYGWV